MFLAEQRSMTIPSRPAPAPPGSRAKNAAADANVTLEQLRLQLHQQQPQQQQQPNGGMQRFSIKLPPPPKGSIQHNHFNNNSSREASSITRKFPQARYSPATSWDDTPFNSGGASRGPSSNGNFRKVPPPRPPPPKVLTNVRKMTAPTPPAPASKILTNIFHRKKPTVTSSSKASAGGAARVYGVSSGTYGSVTTTTTTNYASASSNNSYATTGSGAVNWNAWNDSGHGGYATTSFAMSSTAVTTTTSVMNGSGVQEAQLITFDSPPSSPTFTQKSNSDCVSVDSFSSDSNFSSPHNGSVSQPESGFEDDFSAARSRPPTTSPLDPWESLDAYSSGGTGSGSGGGDYVAIGSAPVRNLNAINTRMAANVDNPLCNGKSLLPPAPSLAMPTIIKPKISQKPKAPKPPMSLQFQYNYNNNKNIFQTESHCSTDLPTPPSPPMPQCAPPPPPPLLAGVSLLDVISGKVDAIHLGAGAAFGEETPPQPYGLALYDFDGIEEGDLSFRENEKIYLLEQVNDEWCRGRSRAGCEGIFPINYIDVKAPLADNSANVGEPAQPEQSRQPRIVRCLYNFPAEVHGDLALKENDLVAILYRINEDWLYGEIDGKQGQFPANFLEHVPVNIP